MGKHSRNKKKNDTRAFLKFLLIIMVIALIIALSYMGKTYSNDKETANATANEQQKNTVISKENATESKSKEEKEVKSEENHIEETEEVVKEEPQEEEKIEQEVEEVKQEEQPSERASNNEETSISDEDKAIELAKKQYGSSDGVYFRIEQTVSNGVYEVSVRDAETTVEYAWYRVDVRNGTVK